MITQLKEKVLNGGQITREEAILLSNAVDKQALYRAAGEIRDKRVLPDLSIWTRMPGRPSLLT